jgi:hypothetical protein
MLVRYVRRAFFVLSGERKQLQPWLALVQDEFFRRSIRPCCPGTRRDPRKKRVTCAMGYEPTREAAMAAFAKSWRSE